MIFTDIDCFIESDDFAFDDATRVFLHFTVDSRLAIAARIEEADAVLFIRNPFFADFFDVFGFSVDAKRATFFRLVSDETFCPELPVELLARALVVLIFALNG